MMFAGPTNENWESFHNKYGTVEDPANRRSMMKSAVSAMGGLAKSGSSRNVTGKASGGCDAPTRGQMPRSSSARVLKVSGRSISGKALTTPERTASGGLGALRAALSHNKSGSSRNLLSRTASGGDSRAPGRNASWNAKKPQRSRSPMPDRRRISPGQED